MKKVSFLGYIILNFIAVFLEATPLDSPSATPDSLNETPSKIVFRYRGNKGVGYDKGYATVAAFLTPNWASNFHPYADIRAHLMSDKKFATNIGLGARGAPTEGFGIGGNLFFDYRNVSSMPCYQLGSGLELLSPYLDFRLNGYLPLGHKVHTYEPTISQFEGNTITLKQTTKATLASIYAEFGVSIPKLPELFQLYLAAGPYYLGSRHMKAAHQAPLKKIGDTCGGKCRLTAQMFHYIDAGVEYTYDSLFRSRVQGHVSLSLPLGPSKLYKLFKKKGRKQESNTSIKFQRQMVQPVDRNEMIPIYQKNAFFTPEAKFLFVDETVAGEGDGTFEKPFKNLREARSIPNDGVILFKQGETDKDLDKNSEAYLDNEFVFVTPPPPKKSPKKPLKERLDEVEGGYVTKRIKIYVKSLKENWDEMWK